MFYIRPSLDSCISENEKLMFWRYQGHFTVFMTCLKRGISVHSEGSNFLCQCLCHSNRLFALALGSCFNMLISLDQDSFSITVSLCVSLCDSFL